MLRLLYGHDQIVAEFVQRHLGEAQPFHNISAIGVMSDDLLIAGVVYSQWAPTGGTIEMSAFAATPKWFSRRVLRELLEWPFTGLQCQMIILRVSERNARMRRLAEGVGFTGIRIPRLLGRDEAAIVYTLTLEDWRAGPFMRQNDENQFRTAAA